MSIPSYEIVPVMLEQSDTFRSFVRQAQQEAYPRPNLGITPDLFSEAAFDRPEVVAFYAGVCAVNEHKQAWFAVDESAEIVGTIAVQQEADFCELHSLYVSPNLKGNGIGRQLYDQVVKFAGSLPIRLDVVEYMHDTISIYKHWGFKPQVTNSRPNYIWTWWPPKARAAYQGVFMTRNPEENS